MLRDKNLIPFSHQHQHALALCVRIDRAFAGKSPERLSLGDWQAEIENIFATEILLHFDAEEQFLFPAASGFDSLRSLIGSLLSEHATLRDFAKQAQRRALGQDEMLKFSATLSNHIRKEERGLFEGCQKLMTADELARIGVQTEQFFRSNGVHAETSVLPEAQ